MKVNYLVYTVGALISYINVSFIYGHIIKEKFKINIIKMLMIIAMGIVNAYITIHLPVGFKTIYNFICLIIINKMIYNSKIKDILYYVVVIWTVGIVLDMLFMAMFSIALERFLIAFPNIGILIVSLILQILLYLVFRLNTICKLVNNLKKKLEMVNGITWLFILAVGLITSFSVLAFININKINNIVLIILLILITISIILFYITIVSSKKVYQLTIKNLLENNKYYLEANKDNRVFRHNIIHQLNSIIGIADKKVKTLISDLIEDNNLGRIPIKEIESLPNGINGIVGSLLSDNSKDLNLVINNYLEKDLLDILTPKQYNKLCETLGVCLDNAINAAKDSEEKVLQIVIMDDNKQFVLKILNTFNSELEVDKLGTLDYTTKKSGHGIGLYSIFKKKTVIVKTSIINNLFENQLIIKK